MQDCWVKRPGRDNRHSSEFLGSHGPHCTVQKGAKRSLGSATPSEDVSQHCMVLCHSCGHEATGGRFEPALSL